MKRFVLFFFFIIIGAAVFSQIKITAPGVKWDESYSFDRSNGFKVDFYDKNGKIVRAMDYKTYYQSNGDNFSVVLINDGRKNRVETIFDKKNEVGIQIFSGGGAEPLYNTGRYKYPPESELKRLDLVATDEYKEILGYKCRKYTYTYKKIWGECWITTEIDLSNDYGIFRAAKMAAIHNTLSVGGFAMEMTTFDSTNAKTVMQTVSLKNSENYKVDLSKVDMKTAINKVSYYTF
jgi:membrane-bound inhibitor of C-type lysozyme